MRRADLATVNQQQSVETTIAKLGGLLARLMAGLLLLAAPVTAAEAAPPAKPTKEARVAKAQFVDQYDSGWAVASPKLPSRAATGPRILGGGRVSIQRSVPGKLIRDFELPSRVPTQAKSALAKTSPGPTLAAPQEAKLAQEGSQWKAPTQTATPTTPEANSSKSPAGPALQWKPAKVAQRPVAAPTQSKPSATEPSKTKASKTKASDTAPVESDPTEAEPIEEPETLAPELLLQAPTAGKGRSVAPRQDAISGQDLANAFAIPDFTQPSSAGSQTTPGKAKQDAKAKTAEPKPAKSSPAKTPTKSTMREPALFPGFADAEDAPATTDDAENQPPVEIAPPANAKPVKSAAPKAKPSETAQPRLPAKRPTPEPKLSEQEPQALEPADDLEAEEPKTEKPKTEKETEPEELETEERDSRFSNDKKLEITPAPIVKSSPSQSSSDKSSSDKSKATAKDRSQEPQTLKLAPRAADKSAARLRPLSKNQVYLRNRVRSVLSYYYRRPLNSVDHDPWEVMHGMLTYGLHSRILDGGPRGKPMTSIGFLCFNRPAQGHQLMTVTPEGNLDVKVAVRMQGHKGQFLAMLAQCNVSPDYPIRVEGKDFTIMDLLRSEQLTCYTNTELTFKLIGLMHYLDSGITWANDQGETWDFPRLIHEERHQKIRGAACGGTHRLAGLSLAVKKRTERNEPIDGEYAEARRFVEQYQNYALRWQNKDGSLSTEWFRGPGDEESIDRRVRTTGHLLEWLIYSLPEEKLTDYRVVRAVNYLSSVLASNTDNPWEIGPLSHALHALMLYDERVYQPHDKPVTIADKRTGEKKTELRTPNYRSITSRVMASLPSAKEAEAARAEIANANTGLRGLFGIGSSKHRRRQR